MQRFNGVGSHRSKRDKSRVKVECRVRVIGVMETNQLDQPTTKVRFEVTLNGERQFANSTKRTFVNLQRKCPLRKCGGPLEQSALDELKVLPVVF